MAKADTREVAALLREYAQRSALRGGNPYRTKAYSRAADSLVALAIPLDVLIEEGRLKEIPGVGDAIADIVTKLHRTGSHPSLEKLRKEVRPLSWKCLLCRACAPIRCCGSTRIWASLRLPNWSQPPRTTASRRRRDLAQRCKTRSWQNLAIARNGQGRLHMHRAAALLEHAKESLRSVRPVLKRVTVAGDFRRGCELVGDLST